MRKILIVLTILIVSVLLTPIVNAAEIKQRQFNNSSGCYIEMTGQVKETDTQKIINIMEQNACPDGDIGFLQIHSNGGSANGGRNVAGVIKHYGLSTMVSSKEGVAVSAGFSILMAGKEVFVYEDSKIGHHAPWIPEFSYNSHYVGKKPVAPYIHNLSGQKLIVDSINQDLETIPPWLIVKYITKIEGEVYWLTPVDKLKLYREGYIKLLKAKSDDGT